MFTQAQLLMVRQLMDASKFSPELADAALRGLALQATDIPEVMARPMGAAPIILGYAAKAEADIQASYPHFNHTTWSLKGIQVTAVWPLLDAIRCSQASKVKTVKYLKGATAKSCFW